MFCDRLYANIKLNKASNVTVFECALGESNTTQHISFVDKTSDVACKSLSQIILMCGGHVDVLKTDCEGGEWCIQPHELNGIRRIEAEIHCFNGEKQTDFINMLIMAGYMVDANILNNHLMIVHAQR